MPASVLRDYDNDITALIVLLESSVKKKKKCEGIIGAVAKDHYGFLVSPRV